MQVRAFQPYAASLLTFLLGCSDELTVTDALARLQQPNAALSVPTTSSTVIADYEAEVARAASMIDGLLEPSVRIGGSSIVCTRKSMTSVDCTCPGGGSVTIDHREETETASYSKCKVGSDAFDGVARLLYTSEYPIESTSIGREPLRQNVIIALEGRLIDAQGGSGDVSAALLLQGGAIWASIQYQTSRDGDARYLTVGRQGTRFELKGQSGTALCERTPKDQMECTQNGKAFSFAASGASP